MIALTPLNENNILCLALDQSDVVLGAADWVLSLLSVMTCNISSIWDKLLWKY